MNVEFTSLTEELHNNNVYYFAKYRGFSEKRKQVNCFHYNEGGRIIERLRGVSEDSGR